MTSLRAILVDDEPLALRRLSLTLGRLDDIEIVGTTTSAREAVGLIADLNPDVVFLDIAMPGLDGFDVAQTISVEPQPAVIFATAFADHAVDAFSIDAVDYLLKPIAPERLQQAVDRARTWLAARGLVTGAVTLPVHPDRNAGDSSDEGSIWAHRHQGYVRIPLEQVVWIEAEGDYVRIHGTDSGGLIRKTLSAVHAELDSAAFIRVHRSAICRRRAITELQRMPTGALRVALSNGDWAPVGRSYGRSLRTLLEQMQSDPDTGAT